MIKWLPFQSIIPSYELIKKEQLIKPTLSYQKLDDLDNILKYQSNKKMLITYFTNNKYHKITGYITKINYIDKTLTINKTTISIKDITNIEL